MLGMTSLYVVGLFDLCSSMLAVAAYESSPDYDQA